MLMHIPPIVELAITQLSLVSRFGQFLLQKLVYVSILFMVSFSVVLFNSLVHVDIEPDPEPEIPSPTHNIQRGPSPEAKPDDTECHRSQSAM